MRVFATEYLTSGAWPDAAAHPSLMREGRAMISAVLADLSRLDGVRPVTTWSASLEPPAVKGVEWVAVANAAEEEHRFRQLAADADATLIIAPEFDRILETRYRTARRVGGRLPGSELAAVELTSDKLVLAETLQRHGLPTVPTTAFTPDVPPPPEPYPKVVKPRDGAGSQAVRRIDRRDDFAVFQREAASTSNSSNWIIQPHVPGRAISAAAIVRADAAEIDLFPVCDQHLSDDGRYTYRGGTIDPGTVDDELQTAVERLIQATCTAVAGLGGYVGFDLIVPPDRPHDPVIVEINPRLTTSYLGYRELTPDNLAERMLFPDRQFPPIRWDRKPVRFEPDGRTHLSE